MRPFAVDLQVNNYMNYISNACREKYGEFTRGQIRRMIALFRKYRYKRTTCRLTGVRCFDDSHCCSKMCVDNGCAAPPATSPPTSSPQQ
jgi:hypothetical protein